MTGSLGKVSCTAGLCGDSHANNDPFPSICELLNATCSKSCAPKSPRHEENTHRKQFPTPLTSVRRAPPPPIPFSLIKSLRNSQNFSQLPPQKQLLGGSRQWFPRRHPREVLLFGTFFPPVSSSAHRNRSDFCDLRLRCPSRTPEIAAISKTRESNAALRSKSAMESR